MSGDEQLGLDLLGGAAADKAAGQRQRARAAAPGAETSRDAFGSLPLSDLEAEVLAELEHAGPGTAEELGERLRMRSTLSGWGPQTMSGACNRLLHKRRIYRPGDKRPGTSGRSAWVWAVRPASTR